MKSIAKKFEIIKNFKIFGLISVVLCSVGLVSLLVLPFGMNFYNLAIDFAGGTEMEFHMGVEITQSIQDDVKDLFHEVTGMDATVISSGNDNENVTIRSLSIESEVRAQVIEAMNDTFGLTDDDLYGNEDVGQTVGDDLKQAAFASSIVAIILMLCYITYRFELTSGLAAVACLVHDLLVMLSIYVVLQLPLNQNFIAACLLILGYSINASIIVFDRVRENQRAAKGKVDFEECAESAIWASMGRTVNTTITTVLTVGMIYILGVSSLQEFTIPLLIGILSGAYSSIFLSCSIWGALRKRLGDKKFIQLPKREKMIRREVDIALEHERELALQQEIERELLEGMDDPS